MAIGLVAEYDVTTKYSEATSARASPAITVTGSASRRAVASSSIARRICRQPQRLFINQRTRQSKQTQHRNYMAVPRFQDFIANNTGVFPGSSDPPVDFAPLVYGPALTGDFVSHGGRLAQWPPVGLIYV